MSQILPPPELLALNMSTGHEHRRRVTEFPGYVAASSPYRRVTVCELRLTTEAVTRRADAFEVSGS